MIKIFIILLLSIIVLIRFQQSCINNKLVKNKYEIIFNTIKIPLFFIALFIIIYNYDNKTRVIPYDTIMKQELYTINPNF
jgi:hypothetical protein